MIALLGEQGLSYAIKKASNGADVTWLEERSLSAAMNTLLQPKYEYIVIDVMYVEDDPINVLPQLLRRLMEATTKTVIVIGMELRNTSVHIRLQREGIKYFINSEDQVSLIQDLKKAFSGMKPQVDPIVKELADELPPAPAIDVPNKEEILERKQKEVRGSYQTIAFAGMSGGSGVTTQCIQMVKYLKLKGYKACYVEKTPQSNIQKLIQTEIEIDELFVINSEIGIEFYNVKMYLDTPKVFLNELEKYDFVVIDYGQLTKTNNTEFFSRDFTILCVNTAMWHYISFVESFPGFVDLKPWWVLSPTDPDSRSKLRDSFGEWKDKLCFAEYSPDMFSYNAQNDKYISKILGELKPKGKEYRKRGFWRWKR